jgi:hypothetical protein
MKRAIKNNVGCLIFDTKVAGLAKMCGLHAAGHPDGM